MTPGETFVRLRLGQVQATAEQATGASVSSDNGEIEDHQIRIVPAVNPPSSFGDFCYLVADGQAAKSVGNNSDVLTTLDRNTGSEGSHKCWQCGYGNN